MVSPVRFGITYQIKLPESDFTDVSKVYHQQAGESPLLTVNASSDDILSVDKVKVRLSEDNQQMMVITSHEASEQADNIDAIEQVFRQLGLTSTLERLLDVFPWESKDSKVEIELPEGGKLEKKAKKLSAEVESKTELVELQEDSVEQNDQEKKSDQLPTIEKINAHKGQKKNLIFKAILENDIEQLTLLMSHPQINPNLTKEGVMTPLEYASHDGNIDCVRVLLKHPKTTLGDAYKVATKEGHSDIVKLLEAYGANPENINWNADKKLAKKLNKAIENNDALGAIAIINHPKFDPDQIISGATIFYIACLEGKEDLVERILANCKPDVNTQKQHNRFTPLAAAAAGGHIEVIQLLLEQPDTNPFLQNKKGKSPVKLARVNGHEDAAKLIETFIEKNFQA